MDHEASMAQAAEDEGECKKVGDWREKDIRLRNPSSICLSYPFPSSVQPLRQLNSPSSFCLPNEVWK